MKTWLIVGVVLMANAGFTIWYVHKSMDILIEAVKEIDEQQLTVTLQAVTEVLYNIVNKGATK